MQRLVLPYIAHSARFCSKFWLFLCDVRRESKPTNSVSQSTRNLYAAQVGAVWANVVRFVRPSWPNWLGTLFAPSFPQLLLAIKCQSRRKCRISAALMASHKTNPITPQSPLKHLHLYCSKSMRSEVNPEPTTLRFVAARMRLVRVTSVATNWSQHKERISAARKELKNRLGDLTSSAYANWNVRFGSVTCASLTSSSD